MGIAEAIVTCVGIIGGVVFFGMLTGAVQINIDWRRK